MILRNIYVLSESFRKIRHSKIPGEHNMVQEDKYMKIPGNREQNRSNAVKEAGEVP